MWHSEVGLVVLEEKKRFILFFPSVGKPHWIFRQMSGEKHPGMSVSFKDKGLQYLPFLLPMREMYTREWKRKVKLCINKTKENLTLQRMMLRPYGKWPVSSFCCIFQFSVWFDVLVQFGRVLEKKMTNWKDVNIVFHEIHPLFSWEIWDLVFVSDLQPPVYSREPLMQKS